MFSRKGQVAVEYIILISMLLLFFQAVLYPSVNFSENIIKDTSAITQTTTSINKLELSISSIVSSPGYGKRLTYFYLPKNSTLSCDENSIHYNITISNQKPIPPLTNCVISQDKPNVNCSFSKEIYGTPKLSCVTLVSGYNGYLVIEKNENGEINVTPPN